ncbi:MAG: hypothetical protein GXP40_04320 [Chloroflexi bacterium]|nr:hypothetical protein [Chloroflexota bacterium]
MSKSSPKRSGKKRRSVMTIVADVFTTLIIVLLLALVLYILYLQVAHHV